MEQWFVINKKADFREIGRRFGIDQVTARIIRNRDIVGEREIGNFLQGGLGQLHDPHLLRDADLFVDVLTEKIRGGAAIRIIGDYDIDGVMSTYILKTAFAECGADVSAAIPDRVRDGYGLNRHLITQAYEAGIDTVVTCDNGIAAIEEIRYAKSLGMTVLVTDHHEVPFEEKDGEKIYIRSAADAVVNPHQKDCPYPYKELCGAGVAWKLVCLLYERWGIPQEKAELFLENVAFATVGDIMNLTGENRILVKEGLKRIHRTQNIGMRALIGQCGLEPADIDAYHFGFVLGPCINASGRLDTAQRALALFSQTSMAQAAQMAQELVALNMERKEMTEAGVEEAVRVYEQQGYERDPVVVLYLPGVHESIAGIIAGRIRERYYKPVFILTKTEPPQSDEPAGQGAAAPEAAAAKGSGRSVEAYSMYEEMCRCKEFFTKFGGHPMAAGLSMPEENIEPFRKKINELCPPECRNLVQKIRIDVPMPVDYVTMDLVRELEILAPFGKGNPRPVFADKGIAVERMWVVGKNRNVLRLSLRSAAGTPAAGIFFGDIPAFEEYLADKFGAGEVEAAYGGKMNRIVLSVIYYPMVNCYRGNESLQFEIKSYQ